MSRCYSVDADPPQDNRKPSLVIPLIRSPNFLLVHGDHISVCKDALAGPPTIQDIRPPALVGRLQPADNRCALQWVQWARAPRNPEFIKEVFYLAREDGVIVYLEYSEKRIDKFKQPWRLYALVGICSLGAAVQGTRRLCSQ